MDTNEKGNTTRRSFLGNIATGAAAMGLATLAPLQQLQASPTSETNPIDADEWIRKIKDKKHKVVFDVTEPHEVFPFAWPRVFLITNEASGSPAKDNGAVVVLRHGGIPYAFEDKLWAKYNLGQMFKINGADGKPSTKNAFWKPAPGTYKFPGIGEVPIGINELQDSGVMFCVCNAAITVYSAVAAQSMNMKHEDVMSEWKANLLPGIQVVPSGVWAVGRAQEYGCGYIFVR